MDWHYAAGTERKGPLSEMELKALVTGGTIQRTTLVWNPTFTEWRSAEAAGLFADAGTPPDLNSRLCIITGKIFPTSQMIETEHGWVSVEGRDTYYQCLREGVPFPNAGIVSNARADGKKMVVPVKDARLPLRCVKTNLPVTTDELKKKTLWWCPPLVLLSILLNLLVMLVLYFIFRKSVKLEIPLSKQGRGIVRKHVLIATTLCLGGLVLIIVGVANVDSGLIGLLFVGIVALIVGLVWSGRKATALRIVKYKDGEAWLVGAHPDFVASLPPY